jgi:hypothetical protein
MDQVDELYEAWESDPLRTAAAVGQMAAAQAAQQLAASF